MLELRNVKIVLEGRVILKNVNFKIKAHESVVFIGPSGSGKTVLLKTLAGIYKAQEGEVLLDGEDYKLIDNEHKHELAKKLGMLFQQGALFDTLTAIENVEFPIREHYPELSDKEIRHTSEDLLDKVNLLKAKDKLPSELSGGMQKRLGIARTLALNPKIIFYDDPVAGQDPIQKDQMLTLISDFKKKNNSILIMVSSNIKDAYRMGDRIFMIIDEEVIDAGSPEQIKNHSDPRIQQFIHGAVEGPIKLG